MSRQQQLSSTVKVPLWMSGFYSIFTLSMIVWILHLLHTTPSIHLGIHWRWMWGVFDAALFVQGGIAAYLLLKKSAWACLPLASLATLFAVDMWFDFMTSVTSVERAATLKITVSAEIPLTILSAGCAIYILRQVVKSK